MDSKGRNRQKVRNSSTVHQQMNEQIQCVYTVDYLATKRNGTLIYIAGINLESLMLSERSQIQKIIFK